MTKCVVMLIGLVAAAGCDFDASMDRFEPTSLERQVCTRACGDAGVSSVWGSYYSHVRCRDGAFYAQIKDPEAVCAHHLGATSGGSVLTRCFCEDGAVIDSTDAAWHAAREAVE